MYVALLGRQPAIGIAELERVFSDVTWFSDQSALIEAPSLNIERLGGTLKAGRVVATLPRGDWRTASMKLVKAYASAWSTHNGKITLGISAYGFDKLSPREVQKTGIVLKQKLKVSDVSLRLIPNNDIALNTATSHHNKLGLSDNKVELLIVRGSSGKIIIAESVGAQNISALAKRDQERPKRDAFVGMLPPKLAQIIINLGVGSPSESTTILDPFCGTGVVLQEAMLLGYKAYGTDLREKMIDYSQQNLEWLQRTHKVSDVSFTVEPGDAQIYQWHAANTITAVTGESYLGQPFSAPPSPSKLTEVRGNCNKIIATFLTNIHRQLAPGTTLCVAVPAWKAIDGTFTHLPLTRSLEQLGYKQLSFKTVEPQDLLYYREDQIVARELLVLGRI